VITNVFSVDVEEYYHAEIFRRATGVRPHGHFESRVERSMDQLLALLSEHRATGTFFVLGEIAALHPAMVRTIAELGHEVACHSDRHESVHRQSPGEFRADTRQAKARIEDVIGDRIVGYRAPNFSIGPAQAWAYQILIEEGFTYDSSLFPILHDRYGQAGAPRFPYEICRNGAATLLEFPIGTTRFLGINFPIGGGGYFRLAPFALVRQEIERVNLHEQRPVMFYVHPWEMDPGMPRPAMAWHHRFRHFVGVDKQADKIDRLLTHFRFGTARQVLETTTRTAVCVPRINPSAMPAEPRVSA
jgi:polysaccharide deacetylase family protein (PEP-CTERM system associated)